MEPLNHNIMHHTIDKFVRLGQYIGDISVSLWPFIFERIVAKDQYNDEFTSFSDERTNILAMILINQNNNIRYHDITFFKLCHKNDWLEGAKFISDLHDRINCNDQFAIHALEYIVTQHEHQDFICKTIPYLLDIIRRDDEKKGIMIDKSYIIDFFIKNNHKLPAGEKIMTMLLSYYETAFKNVSTFGRFKYCLNEWLKIVCGYTDNVQFVRLLIDAGAHPFVGLAEAVKYQDKTITQYIINLIRDNDEYIFDQHKWTEAILAVCNNPIDDIILFNQLMSLKRGNFDIPYSEQLIRFIYCAFDRNCLTIFRQLLEECASISCCDVFDLTDLMYYSIKNKNRKAFRIILKAIKVWSNRFYVIWHKIMTSTDIETSCREELLSYTVRGKYYQLIKLCDRIYFTD